MKRKLLIVLALVLIVPGLLMTTACTSKKAKSDPGLSSQTSSSEIKGPKSGGETKITRSETRDVPGSSLTIEEQRFVNEDVYFAYDSSALDSAAQGVLKSKADFMRSNSGVAVTIQGHCDERGTSEYNMALGQKRADSVKKFLINLGVSASRMNTTSLGKEQPIDPGHTEAAWSKNRRAHFVR